MEDNFEKMLNQYNSPEIQGCVTFIDSIINYKLTEEDKNTFLYLHNFITNPQPNFITKWREDERKEKWYHKFTNRFLDDTQNALICVRYHYDNLIRIENSIMTGIEQYDYKKILAPSSAIGLGSSLVWDFEYQAFVLAYRRTLDYLTKALCSYFTNDFHSFRKLSEYLQKQNRPTFTKPLIEVINKYMKEFDFVMSDGERKSIRDRISHYEYAKVGVINLNSRGLILVGGAEDLGINGNNQQLSEILEKRMNNLSQCIKELIYTYIECIKLDEIEKEK